MCVKINFYILYYYKTKIGENGSLSFFMSVDFDTKGYYGETEYVHQLPWLAKGLAVFLQLRLSGTGDGKLTDIDNQTLIFGLNILIN